MRSGPTTACALDGCIILNSVKCLPPQNKPLPAEVATCRRYYEARWRCCRTCACWSRSARSPMAIAVRTAGGRLPAYKFGHLAEHVLPDGRILIDSYHCSRYNQNTGRLTAAMFEAVFARALQISSVSRP